MALVISQCTVMLSVQCFQYMLRVLLGAETESTPLPSAESSLCIAMEFGAEGLRW